MRFDYVYWKGGISNKTTVAFHGKITVNLHFYFIWYLLSALFWVLKCITQFFKIDHGMSCNFTTLCRKLSKFKKYFNYCYSHEWKFELGLEWWLKSCFFFDWISWLTQYWFNIEQFCFLTCIFTVTVLKLNLDEFSILNQG